MRPQFYRPELILSISTRSTAPTRSPTPRLIALARALKVSEDYLLNPADVELVGVECLKQQLTSAKETAEVRKDISSRDWPWPSLESTCCVRER